MSFNVNPADYFLILSLVFVISVGAIPSKQNIKVVITASVLLFIDDVVSADHRFHPC